MEEKYKFRVKGNMFDHILIGGEEGGILHVWSNNVVTIVGADFGRNMTLHYTGGQYFVVKVPGQQWYLNQYQGMKYEPAKYLVFRMIHIQTSMHEGLLEFLFEFPQKTELPTESVKS